MSYSLKLAFFLSLFFLHSVAQADVKVFNVEVIAFKQSAPSSEVFDQTESEIDAVSHFARAISGKKTMNALYKRLKKSNEYSPFYYKAWQVSAISGRMSLPIEIYDAGQKMAGWIKIQRGELLHIHADIEISPLESLAEDGLIYHLKEKRRVLYRELHYLDHPKFGLIVRVLPK